MSQFDFYKLNSFFFFFLFFFGTISQVEFAIHSQLWHLQLVYKAVRVWSMKNWPGEFLNLGNQGRICRAAGGNRGGVLWME